MEFLQKIYALTPRECVVAVEIASGKNTREVAETLGISVGTVRVHVKRIFGKTGTNRQSQLVGLVLMGALGRGDVQDATQ